jgi:type VI secretion system protein ImpB
MLARPGWDTPPAQQFSLIECAAASYKVIRGEELSAMSKEGSVAPKERVNITYKPAIGNAKEEVELPLKMLMLGDYTQRPDPRPLEDRKPINIDKDNFQKVMSEQKLALNFAVKDKLSESEDSELNVNLKFRRLSDMEPEAIANQVPELKKLLDLRAALTALKGPLGNEKAFRNKIQQILGDPAQRNKIINELGLKKEGE